MNDVFHFHENLNLFQITSRQYTKSCRKVESLSGVCYICIQTILKIKSIIKILNKSKYVNKAKSKIRSRCHK
jgi:hypothetical protein